MRLCVFAQYHIRITSFWPSLILKDEKEAKFSDSIQKISIIQFFYCFTIQDDTNEWIIDQEAVEYLFYHLLPSSQRTDPMEVVGVP